MKSYFVPVDTGRELWLDFNGNNKNPYHLAVVVSVQGINAVTGLECKDAQLEQYILECPKHKEPFGADRYCKSCGYHWPKQNYVCSTGTPHGCLWLDGFRAAEGVIRQFLLTEEKMRGVAAGVIGENRVFAFGISFFLSRSPRAQIVQESQGGTMYKYGVLQDSSGSMGYARYDKDMRATCKVVSRKGGVPDVLRSQPQFFSPVHDPKQDIDQVTELQMSSPKSSPNKNGDSFDVQDQLAKLSNDPKTVMTSHSCYTNWSVADRKIVPDKIVSIADFDQSGDWVGAAAANANNRIYPIADAKKLEIAAGARIDQMIYPDPCPLDFWRDKPEGIVVINYVCSADARRILEGGEQKQSVHAEGFLQSVPVGN